MGETSGMNSVLLLDNYGEDSRMLHQAFKASGFKGKVVVVDDEGFLPEDVISVYRYFCGTYKDQPGVPGKPRYFNQINIPDYWEIEANNTNGRVMNLYRQRGTIFYTEPAHRRLVKVVDWMDEHEIVRSCDHYDCYGALYARTTFNNKGQRFCKTYYDAQMREVLVENYVTNDIILNRNQKVYICKSKVDLIKKLFEIADIHYDSIYYNSLSTPFFVSESMHPEVKRDILFWQENPRNDIPGNMRIILDGRATRTELIYVQKKESYEKLIELGADPAMVKPLGFVYNYQAENSCGNDILICTNSDQIEQLDYLVENLPDMHFHIAAITEMSSGLMSMIRYDNVSVYPNVKNNVLDELFEKCDFYLDINYYNEIVSAVKTAFVHDQLILGFSDTLHNRDYIAADHIFTSAADMVGFLKDVNSDSEILKERLLIQKQYAMAEDAGNYEKLFI